jgi:peptidyl-prolyl cis-trans isomerase C
MFVVLFVAGCTSKKGSDSLVLAKAGKAEITKEDFIRELNRVPEWARGNFQTDEGKKQFLDELIKKELIYQDAKKKGLERDEKFKAEVEEFQKMTLIKSVLEKEVEEKAKLDPKEVRDFYDRHPDEFKVGLEVRASHILVDGEEDAKNLLQRIQQGESFSSLAKEFSKDKDSAKNGGDMGFFGRGRMVPEFERVTFSLKIGEVSNPVKTRFGYHIIKVTDRKEGRVGDFEEVKNAIARRLAIEKQRDLFESYIEKLKKEYKTEIYEAELKGLKIGEGEEQSPATEGQ